MAETYVLTPARKRINQLLKGLANLGVPMGNLSVLTVPGRRSRQPRATPVNLVVEAGRRWLVAPYGEIGWVQNLRAAGGRAQLKHRGKTEQVRVQELQPAEAAPILKRYLGENKIVTPFLDAKVGDPTERFIEEAATHPVFEIAPAQASGRQGHPAADDRQA